MATVIIERPASPLVPKLMQDFNAAADFFEKGASDCNVWNEPLAVSHGPQILELLIIPTSSSFPSQTYVSGPKSPTEPPTLANHLSSNGWMKGAVRALTQCSMPSCSSSPRDKFILSSASFFILVY
jgi:hypothetical protein